MLSKNRTLGGILERCWVVPPITQNHVDRTIHNSTPTFATGLHLQPSLRLEPHAEKTDSITANGTFPEICWLDSSTTVHALNSPGAQNKRPLALAFISALHPTAGAGGPSVGLPNRCCSLHSCC